MILRKVFASKPQLSAPWAVPSRVSWLGLWRYIRDPETGLSILPRNLKEVDGGHHG